MRDDWRYEPSAPAFRYQLSAASDCYIFDSVDLSVFGTPKNGEGGLAFSLRAEGVDVPGHFAAALMDGDRLIGIGHSGGIGFVAGWEDERWRTGKSIPQLTVLLKSNPIVVSANLPVGHLEGVRVIDSIPLVAYLEHEVPGWGQSYRTIADRDSSHLGDFTGLDPANIAYLTGLFPELSMVRYPNAQSHVSKVLRDYFPTGND